MRGILETLSICCIAIFGSLSHAYGDDGSCNCSIKKGSCSATASFSTNSVLVKSSSNQCSQIIYSLNGDPGSITIKGGQGSIEWLGQSRPSVSIDSCSICASTDEGRNDQSDQDELDAILTRAKSKLISDADRAAKDRVTDQKEAAVQQRIYNENTRRLNAKIARDLREMNQNRRQAAAPPATSKSSSDDGAALGAFLNGLAGGVASGMSQSGSTPAGTPSRPRHGTVRQPNGGGSSVVCNSRPGSCATR